jgi:hypothetical protein
MTISEKGTMQQVTECLDEELMLERQDQWSGSPRNRVSVFFCVNVTSCLSC